MNYYRSTITGHIFDDSDLSVINLIYGTGASDKVVSDGTLEKIDPPSVIEFLKDGFPARAYKRYREIHGCTLKEAIDAVKKIERDMHKFEKTASKK